MHTLKGHLDYSFAVAWHPNGVVFATGNQVRDRVPPFAACMLLDIHCGLGHCLYWTPSCNPT